MMHPMADKKVQILIYLLVICSFSRRSLHLGHSPILQLDYFAVVFRVLYTTQCQPSFRVSAFILVSALIPGVVSPHPRCRQPSFRVSSALIPGVVSPLTREHMPPFLKAVSPPLLPLPCRCSLVREAPFLSLLLFSMPLESYPEKSFPAPTAVSNHPAHHSLIEV